MKACTYTVARCCNNFLVFCSKFWVMDWGYFIRIHHICNCSLRGISCSFCYCLALVMPEGEYKQGILKILKFFCILTWKAPTVLNLNLKFPYFRRFILVCFVKDNTDILINSFYSNHARSTISGNAQLAFCLMKEDISGSSYYSFYVSIHFWFMSTYQVVWKDVRGLFFIQIQQNLSVYLLVFIISYFRVSTLRLPNTSHT